jgi:hypothetical protein
VTSRRPTLRWALTQGDGARLELCRDRVLNASCHIIDFTGTQGAPPSDLAPGVWFWRVTTRVGAVMSSSRGPIWEFTVGARSAPVDTSWGTIPDFNGDGRPDLAKGATLSHPNGTVLVYHGPPAAGFDTSPATTSLAAPDGPGSQFGTSVASAGDVNGDGFADLIVGATGTFNVTGRTNTGCAYLYLGGVSGLPTSPAVRLTGPDGLNGNFGFAVTSAGDVNGDGYADVAVSAIRANFSAGRVYIYLGSATGLAPDPSATLNGPSNGTFFGHALAGAGDVNGDGYGDLLVGSSNFNDLGRAYLYAGSAGGLATTPATTLTAPVHPSQFGSVLASAGDVNGDGYADVVVAAPAENSNTGGAYVYRGGATGLAATPSASLLAIDGPGGFFGQAVAGAGDVNGDGFGDVAVGVPEVTPDGIQRGRVHVFFGSVTGPDASPSASLSDVNARGFGGTLGSGRDVDGDGFADLLIGEPGQWVYVFRGGASGPGPNRWTVVWSPIFAGSSLASADDVHGGPAVRRASRAWGLPPDDRRRWGRRPERAATTHA